MAAQSFCHAETLRRVGYVLSEGQLPCPLTVIRGRPKSRIWFAAAWREMTRAAAALVERFERQVFALCYRMLGQREDAEDVVQESFVRALRSLRSWDNESRFRPWLLAIAGNRCRTLLAARARRPRPASEVEHIEDRHAGARNCADLAKRWSERWRVLAEYRQAFVLFHEQELSYGEIAEAMACPLGTVKTWVHRARRELIEQLRLAKYCGRIIVRCEEFELRLDDLLDCTGPASDADVVAHAVAMRGVRPIAAQLRVAAGRTVRHAAAERSGGTAAARGCRLAGSSAYRRAASKSPCGAVVLAATLLVAAIPAFAWLMRSPTLQKDNAAPAVVIAGSATDRGTPAADGHREPVDETRVALVDQVRETYEPLVAATNDSLAGVWNALPAANGSDHTASPRADESATLDDAVLDEDLAASIRPVATSATRSVAALLRVLPGSSAGSTSGGSRNEVAPPGLGAVSPLDIRGGRRDRDVAHFRLLCG